VRSGGSAARAPGGGISMTTVLIAVGVLAIVAVLVYAVTQADNVDSGPSPAQEAELDDDPNIPGVYYAPHPGPDGVLHSANQDDRQHFSPGTVIPICTQAQLDAGNFVDPLCYTSNPPTSGPHSSTPMPFRVLENPAPKENLIHNMEHGGVVIWYNTTDQAAIDELKSIAQDNIDRRRFVVMSAYSGMEADTIAITAWTRLDKFAVSDLTEERVQEFIDANHKRFNPEGF
jgi:hypothetical protein